MKPVGALIAAALALIATAAYCSGDADTRVPSTRVSRGHVRIEREVHSPDGRLVARYSVIWGGGAAGYVQEVVEIRPRGDTAAPDEASAILDMSHGGDVTMTWHDPHRLEIVYPGWAEVLRGCSNMNGIAVRHVPRETPDSLWSDTARGLWRQERIMEADRARRGEPSLRGSNPNVVRRCP